MKKGIEFWRRSSMILKAVSEAQLGRLFSLQEPFGTEHVDSQTKIGTTTSC